ncbi:hypothetical protein KTI63_07055 [Acinetobacter guillouiae]|uniref:hypothetical protein n=1 Tax=Acinetobacter guillouiae TaxID=106649 RepID=UPI0021CE55A2|nr:hypothetical protein [Acinetobacter guillouiae]MCU4492232.1 hypothetical protein [Acinetobacter guillouiae]
MKSIKIISCALISLFLTTAVMAKTEQITLKKDLGFGEEAVIFPTTKGEVILNSYALSATVAKQIKSYKKGQCLEIQSQYGFFKDTGDGQYIQSIRPCKSTSGLAVPKVNR